MGERTSGSSTRSQRNGLTSGFRLFSAEKVNGFSLDGLRDGGILKGISFKNMSISLDSLIMTFSIGL